MGAIVVDRGVATGSTHAPVPGSPELIAQFPALFRNVDGVRLAYLDNTAATMKPQGVIDSLVDFYSNRPANVHRGIHLLSEESSDAFERARAKVAAFIGAGSPHEVVFTRNTTEAVNLLANSFAQRLGPGDEILTTVMEHHANIVPWQMVRDRTGCTLKFAGITPEGRLDLADWHGKLSERTKLVCFAHVSNVLGVVNPVRELADAAHRVGAQVFLDTAQGAPHVRLNLRALEVDYAACSGYKMLGPFGIGALWGRMPLLKAMPAYQTGGAMIVSVAQEHSEFAPPPYRFEAGTPAVGDAVAWGAAVDFLASIGMEAIEVHEHELSSYLHSRLLEIPGLRIMGKPGPDKLGIASFALDFAHPHDIAQVLNAEGVAVRAGHHCAEPLHTAYGLQSSARASLYIYNTHEDVDQLVSAIGTVREIFA